MRRAAPLVVRGVLLAAVAAPLPAGAAALSAQTGGVGAERPVLTPADRAAPSLEWRLERLDGGTVSLAELAGRPVVINAWATWCLPCVAELRSFEALARSLDGEDVAFVMVSPEERERVARWVRRRGYALPFFVEGTRIPEDFGLRALPTTWILDREGRLVLRHRGALDWDRPEVRALLRRLAAERSP